MKRFAFALLGVVILSLSTGCCGWWTPFGWQGGYGYGGGYAPGGCATGNCGVPQGGQGGTYVGPQTSNFHSPESFQGVQMGIPQPIQGPVTAVPTGYPAIASPNYPQAPVPQMATMPLESLPTY